MTDQSGALVPGAQILATAPDGAVKQATSGADGAYLLNGLAPGKYSVRASAPGLSQPDASSVDVSGSVSNLNLALRIVLENQQVTVQDQLSVEVNVDPSQSAAALVVNGDNLDALSDDPDDLLADLQALAGPAAGPSGAQFYIDGFTAGDAVLPSKASIREIRVNQNPFSPEFDAIGYGRTEIFTKPGMDKYRGQAYLNSGSDLFNSRNPYAAQQAPYSLYDGGASFGGPLNKKSSFFVDFSDRHIDSGVVINGVVVDPASFAINPFSQVASSPNARIRISPRLDYQLSKNHTLMVRYALTSTSNEGNGIGGFNLLSRAYNQTNVEHAYQATETWVVNNNTIDETHFQFLHQHQLQSSPDTDPGILVSSAFNGGGPANSNYFYTHHHYEVQNNVSIVSGAHTIKTGIRLRAVSIQDSTRANFNGTWVFGGAYAPALNANFQPLVPGLVCSPATQNAGCQTITSVQQYQRTLALTAQGLSGTQIQQLGGGPTQFSLNAGSPLVLVGQVDAGIYAGDDWRLRPNLTFSYGLRYEVQTNIHDRTNFAPRIAVAWAPGKASKGGTQKTVIRFGSGIFYDRFNEQNTLIAERFNGASETQYTIVNPVLSIPTAFPAITAAGPLDEFATSQAIHTVSSSMVAPYVIQSALGFERQLPRNTTIAVTWTNSHGLHQLLSRNINAPLPGTYTGVTGSGVYPFAGYGPIFEMESAGLYNQNQIVTNFNTRLNKKISLFGYYTLSYADSNTDGVNTFPANQYNMSGEYGPSGNDVRNRGTIGGSITTKWDLRLSPLITLQSGMPFDITTSQDVYGDTLSNARPGIVTNPNQPGAIQTKYGLLDPNPQPGEAILPRNSGRGPGQFSVDLRVARTWVLRRGERAAKARPSDSGGAAPVIAAPVAGPPRRNGIGGFDNASTAVSDPSLGKAYNLTLGVAGRNILNHVNQGPIIGNINSPEFGQSNQLAGGNSASSNRRFEFQLRLAF
ncbi:MAG TPA: carboxypeptidase-like regulatory domain-containing protein [Bryobacteraceae bacterium]|nr:carboxypeptidase-like regulatory domain-containing protein [Bryobacteraceae bacterium]